MTVGDERWPLGAAEFRRLALLKQENILWMHGQQRCELFYKLIKKKTKKTVVTYAYKKNCIIKLLHVLYNFIGLVAINVLATNLFGYS